MSRQFSTMRAAIVVALTSAGLAGCATSGGVTRVRLSERECLARVMYFESNRSSDAGMIAVGTVVMNRLKSGKYGTTVCQVVGAPKQFAPGVLTRPMTDRGAPRAYRNADLVLTGKRHYGVQNAMFFHTYGYRFPYRNMHYLVTAGGNTFYEKKQPPKGWFGNEGSWPAPPKPSGDDMGGDIMVASAKPKIEIIPDEPKSLMVADDSISERDARPASRRPDREIQVASRDALPEAPEPLYDRRSAGSPGIKRIGGKNFGGRPDDQGMYASNVAERDEPAPRRVAAAEDYRRTEIAPPAPMPSPVRARRAPEQSYQVARNEEPREDFGGGYDARPEPRQSPSRRGIESAPLAPPPGMASQPRMAQRDVASREMDYDAAPAPVRATSRVASREVSPSVGRQPMQASAGPVGWNTGPAPAVDYDAAGRAAYQERQSLRERSRRGEDYQGQTDGDVQLRSGDSIVR